MGFEPSGSYKNSHILKILFPNQRDQLHLEMVLSARAGPGPCSPLEGWRCILEAAKTNHKGGPGWSANPKVEDSFQALLYVAQGEKLTLKGQGSCRGYPDEGCTAR